MVAGSTFGELDWTACESVIRRFEDAWREDARPDIGAYIETGSPHSVRLLVELVHIDLEFRLRADDFARAEDYIERFPELGTAELVIELLLAEFALRNRHGTRAWPEEYLLRFPEHIAELRARLPAEGHTSGFAATRPAERPGAPLTGLPIIPGYQIEGELGRGGMGIVYKARDLLLHRTVAIKTFATVPRADSCIRFAREAEAIARLDHPNIVPVYEVGEWRSGDGPAVPFFVMKWYPGGSMDAAPAGRDSDVHAHARSVETIARAVHHAHQRGVLHRDLKPSNILLDDAGRPHVADFGLAGRVDPDAATLTAVVAGTPAFMAPEQAKSPKHVSTAADVYGLGAILYHQLTGRAPFAADTPLATLELVANEPPAPPSESNPAVSRDLDTICLKCLDKDPTRRYTNAAELADDLERWRKGLPISARPARAWELAWRRVRRHPFVTALSFTTVAALVAAVVILSVSIDSVSEKEKEMRLAYLRECQTRYKLEDSLAREQTTRHQMEEALLREQRALYLERVTAAGRLYMANQLTEAWALLDQCPEAFRGWEWHYLDSLRRSAPAPLSGHAAPVLRVAFLADGRVISADRLGAVRTWNATTKQPERTWTVPSKPVSALAVHPKKNWAAVADLSSVTVWSADTGRVIARLPRASWVAFNPDGKTVATAYENAIRLWKVPEDEPPAKPGSPDAPPPEWESAGELTGYTGAILAGAFTSNGKLLVTSSSDFAIRTWDLEAGKVIGNRRAGSNVTGLALVTNERALVEAHTGTVLITDRASGEVRDRLEQATGDRIAVASSRDGNMVAFGTANGEVIVWNVLQRRPERVYRGHSDRITAVAFGPDGRLVSCGIDHTVRLWDLNREPDVRTLANVGTGNGGLAISPNGALVAVGPRDSQRGKEPQALILDAATGRELHRLTGGPDIAFHLPTGRLATGKLGGGAILWDPTTGSEIWNKPFPNVRAPFVTVPGGRRMSLTRDGALLAQWDPRAGGIQLWNANDGTDAGVLDTGRAVVSALEFAPNGARLAVAATDTVTVWDVQTRERVPWGEGAPGAAALAYSPNGRWVATADADHAVRLRDSATGREVRRFVGPALRVNVLCFSPDGTRLATGGADRTLRVWDVESGRELLSLPGLTEAVTGIAWEAKHNRIYALDHAVRVWEVRGP